MASHRIEVALLPKLADAEGASAAAGLKSAGAKGVTGCRVVRVFNVSGTMSMADVERLAAELLSDKVVDIYAIDKPVLKEKGYKALEIARHPGVMDPAEQSIKRGAKALGAELEEVWTAKRFLIKGNVESEKLAAAARRILANEVIEFVSTERLPAERPHPGKYNFKLVTIPLFDMDEKQMVETSRKMVLSLNAEEMKTVQNHFRKLGRNPTDAELETIAQTWSEHCVHKTLKGLIHYEGKTIDNLLKATINSFP